MSLFVLRDFMTFLTGIVPCQIKKAVICPRLYLMTRHIPMPSPDIKPEGQMTSFSLWLLLSFGKPLDIDKLSKVRHEVAYMRLINR